eukprot:TRINITY_DN13219_c0_g2_i5.p1 TRINITY_DN13219_c0_g2~~TRINITY_DN13219_c0_g2_i5.p1  ORF type:complete len:335 (-),score=72.35 TRINITY_DN13219_c0_g2_i5:192-1196(-)
MSEKKNHDSMQVAAAVSFYFVCSLSLVFLNKFIFSGALKLDAPIFLTWTQIVVTVVLCLVLSTLSQKYGFWTFLPPWQYNLRTAYRILPLTIVFILMIMFNNLCLKYVEVTFYQVARSLTIIFNIVFSFFLFNETTSRRCMMACFVVIIGYILGVDGEINFSMTGVVFGVLSSAFLSLYSILVKKYLREILNDNSWLLMYYNNMSTMYLMPLMFVPFGEVGPVVQSQQLYTWPAFFLLLFAGVVGTLINIATFFQIQYTTALTHNVSGTAKACVQSILAWIIFRNPLSAKAVFGLVLSIFGSFWYAVIRHEEAEAAKRAKQIQLTEIQGETPKP